MAVFVRNVTATARMMDGDALLTPRTLEQIVAAVLEALDAHQADQHSRAQDTRIGGACCDGCASEERGR